MTLARFDALNTRAAALIGQGYSVINLGQAPVRIRRGDRIAQFVVAPVATVAWQEVVGLPASERGDGGFGSTDRPRPARRARDRQRVG